MLKKSFIVFLVCSIICSIFGISSLAISFDEPELATSIAADIFSSLSGSGIRFSSGVVSPVQSSSEVALSLSSFSLRQNSVSSVYELSFSYAGKVIQSTGRFIAARFNNYDGQHFLFAPSTFYSDGLSFTKIALAFSANEHDLLPTNQHMINSPVFTIYLTEDATGALLMFQVAIPNSSFTPTSISISERTDTLVSSANEYFFAQQDSISFELTKDQYENNIVTLENESVLSSDLLLPSDSLSASNGSEDNPYYDQGIPNYIFETANQRWRKGQALFSSSLMYISYSFYGQNTTNVYTYFMLLEVYGNVTSGSTLTQGNITLRTASGFAQMKILATSTVIYNGSTYSLMLGGEEMIRIQNPSIEISKDGSYANQCVYRNEPSGLGRSGSSSATLSSVLFREVISSSWELGSSFFNILSYISDAHMSFGNPAEWNPVAAEQLTNYRKIIGSQKITMNGYLYRTGDFLSQRTWFAAPSPATAAQITWSAVYEGSFN